MICFTFWGLLGNILSRSLICPSSGDSVNNSSSLWLSSDGSPIELGWGGESIGGSSYVIYSFIRFMCTEPFCNFLWRLAPLKDTGVTWSTFKKRAVLQGTHFFRQSLFNNSRIINPDFTAYSERMILCMLIIIASYIAALAGYTQ